jgi:hypothetical protein
VLIPKILPANQAITRKQECFTENGNKIIHSILCKKAGIPGIKNHKKFKSTFMKRKVFLSPILLAVIGIGILTLSSARPQPGFTTARVYWYDGLECSASISVGGYTTDGTYEYQSFTATRPSGTGIVHQDYPLTYGFTHGTVYRTYQYTKGGVVHNINDYYTFAKTSSEIVDISVPIPIAEEIEDVPVEE